MFESIGSWLPGQQKGSMDDYGGGLGSGGRGLPQPLQPSTPEKERQVRAQHQRPPNRLIYIAARIEAAPGTLRKQGRGLPWIFSMDAHVQSHLPRYVGM